MLSNNTFFKSLSWTPMTPNAFRGHLTTACCPNSRKQLLIGKSGSNVMGSRDPQKQLWSYHVNLDKRVRSDHPLPKLNEALKLDFVREEVTKFYGMKGNVSEDPAVIMRVMLFLCRHVRRAA